MSLLDIRPLAGDEWAKLHPVEAAKEQRDVEKRLKRAIRKVNAGKPVSFADLFAGAFTTRMRLNSDDKWMRRELRIGGSGALHGMLLRDDSKKF